MRDYLKIAEELRAANRTVEEPKPRPTVRIETEMRPHDPRGEYHILGIDAGTLPRERWFETYGDMIEAVEHANPGHDVTTI